MPACNTHTHRGLHAFLQMAAGSAAGAPRPPAAHTPTGTPCCSTNGCWVSSRSSTPACSTHTHRDSLLFNRCHQGQQQKLHARLQHTHPQGLHAVQQMAAGSAAGAPRPPAAHTPTGTPCCSTNGCWVSSRNSTPACSTHTHRDSMLFNKWLLGQQQELHARLQHTHPQGLPAVQQMAAGSAAGTPRPPAAHTPTGTPCCSTNGCWVSSRSSTPACKTCTHKGLPAVQQMPPGPAAETPRPSATHTIIRDSMLFSKCHQGQQQELHARLQHTHPQGLHAVQQMAAGSAAGAPRPPATHAPTRDSLLFNTCHQDQQQELHARLQHTPPQGTPCCSTNAARASSRTSMPACNTHTHRGLHAFLQMAAGSAAGAPRPPAAHTPKGTPCCSTNGCWVSSRSSTPACNTHTYRGSMLFNKCYQGSCDRWAALSCPDKVDPAPAQSWNSCDCQVACSLTEYSIPPSSTDLGIFCQAFILSQLACFSPIRS